MSSGGWSGGAHPRTPKALVSDPAATTSLLAVVLLYAGDRDERPIAHPFARRPGARDLPDDAHATSRRNLSMLRAAYGP
jgi:hypothetical protein